MGWVHFIHTTKQSLKHWCGDTKNLLGLHNIFDDTGMCLYYKCPLPLKFIDICVKFDWIIKQWYFVSLFNQISRSFLLTNKSFIWTRFLVEKFDFRSEDVIIFIPKIYSRNSCFLSRMFTYGALAMTTRDINLEKIIDIAIVYFYSAERVLFPKVRFYCCGSMSWICG